jgi:hypothetical protein
MKNFILFLTAGNSHIVDATITQIKANPKPIRTIQGGTVCYVQILTWNMQNPKMVSKILNVDQTEECYNSIPILNENFRFKWDENHTYQVNATIEQIADSNNYIRAETPEGVRFILITNAKRAYNNIPEPLIFSKALVESDDCYTAILIL